MSKLTFNIAVSYEMKAVVDGTMMEGLIQEIKDFKENKPEEFAKRPKKMQVFMDMILQGETFDEQCKRFLQFRLREAVNELNAEEFTNSTYNDDTIKMTVSPCKVVMHTHG